MEADSSHPVRTRDLQRPTGQAGRDIPGTAVCVILTHNILGPHQRPQLFVLQHPTGMWVFPGGAQGAHETLRDAGLRYLLDLGLCASSRWVLKPLGFVETFEGSKGEKDHWNTHVFAATNLQPSEPPRNPDPGFFSTTGWLTDYRLQAEPTTPATAEVLRLLREVKAFPLASSQQHY